MKTLKSPMMVLLAMILMGSAVVAAEKKQNTRPPASGFAGSVSCRGCHERFYQLWSTSLHGLAMQPYTPEFAKARLTQQQNAVVIGEFKYQADLKGGVVIETAPKGKKKYPIEHVLGGKNVCYFLTPFPKGRLQTLPVAYDLNKREWFDTAASGIRHFPAGETDRPVHWKESPYTFNTACYSCHVSQLLTNYDLKTDRYKTTWAEPGINCESCHGPSVEHNRVFRETPEGRKLQDPKIISWKNFTPEQKNAACSICHAKMSVIAENFEPGDRFFDHFDLATLEDPDFYPDGRDLGENYTYTSWMMSPCGKAGTLHCVICHTSSGRYRFKADEKANEACMPCHEKNVKDAPVHTHHKEGSAGNKCISCHMPMTSFARMNRTDHSMLPPTPAATLAFKSPNACNICHTDKDAAWADRVVREWRPRDYQAPLLARASLVDAGRRRDWSKLPEMLSYVMSKDRDEVFATSLIRIIPASGDPRVVPVLIEAIEDPSPLVRSAAAAALQNVPTKETVQALVDATGDDYRLVRVRAAASLAGYQNIPLDDAQKKTVESATREYLSSILSRPDQWSSHYNMGNYYMDRGDIKSALASYDTALKLEPHALRAMVNESMAYARLGENRKAGDMLRKALKMAPDNAEANFNMGLLKAEENDTQGAERHLKAALKADPQMAQAAYNLCVILSRDRIDEAIGFCRQATELRPGEPRYAYTLAFYQEQKGDSGSAAMVLEDLVDRIPVHSDSYLLLGSIYEKQGKKEEAERIYKRALETKGIPDIYKYSIAVRLNSLKQENEP
ncbi:tetratricopeptide repeat protein [Desulforhabdus amnigena]|jgi:tetratricopeptide (TPR) repeat protein|nr:tetratricopeptide repeat protein [Desulforhabdus amnigena]NLJ27875.1 tetratricopeptide repeat protein [Deltaproteobacteria bacterium]